MTLENVMFYVGGTWQQTPDGAMSLDAETKMGELTTDHAASTYGQPVAIIDGRAYGPGDGVRMSGHETWRIKRSQDGGTITEAIDALLAGEIDAEHAAAKAMIDRWASLEPAI